MDVHTAVLELAESWQKAIVADWQQQNLIRGNLRTEARIAVFNGLAIIICLYWAEGRQLLPFGQLKALRDSPQALQKLSLLWQSFCQQFGQNFSLNWFQFSDSLPIQGNRIQAIIASLYDANFEQTALTIQILGMLYEANLSFFDNFDQGFQNNEHLAAKLTVRAPNHLQNKLKKTAGICFTTD